MRNYIVHTLLFILVITLSLASMLLATHVGALQGKVLNLTTDLALAQARLYQKTPARPTPEFISVSKDVTIEKIEPSRGVSGTKVRIFGTAFTQEGTTVRFGEMVLKPTAVNVTGKTLLFNVPKNLSPDRYAVSVSSTLGTSNVVFFTIPTQVAP